jgi:hypothetical protein
MLLSILISLSSIPSIPNYLHSKGKRTKLET